MKKKICLFSDLHLSYNPRLWKEAFFWERQGYDVVVITMWVSKASRNRDIALLQGHTITYKPFLNLIPGEISPGLRFFYRARKKIAGLIQRYFKIGLPWAISYAPEKMVKVAFDENADLYSAHAECAFYAGRELILKGKKVFFDFEDWFSRDYLVPERPVALLQKLERFALEKGLFSITTSGALSHALSAFYKVDTQPTVIYNGFSLSENLNINSLSRVGGRLPSLIWFSRTVGRYRGIEKLVSSLEYLDKPVELHLLGETTESYKNELNRSFPHSKGHKLFFHDFIQHNQIVPFLSGFDVGLAIEENVNDNRNLTITNKILQYVQAEIKILATKTAGQQEVKFFFPNLIEIVDSISPPEEWAFIIGQMLNAPVPDTKVTRQTFAEIFSQEAQERKLLELTAPYLQ